MGQSRSDIPLPPGALVPLATDAQRENLERFGWYTFAVARDDPRWVGGGIALLLDDGNVLVEIGTMTRAQGAATGMRKLRYERSFEIEPLPVRQIQEMLPRHQLRSALADRIPAGGRLPSTTWSATVEILRTLRPTNARALTALLSRVGGRSAGLSGRALQVAAHERDAVGLALNFAGFDREVLQEAVPDGEGSFVQRLGEVRAMEDPAITFDSLRFLDFKAIDSPTGVVQLREGDEELIVVNANRQRLETTLGADLIYIHEKRRSIVFVQYKTMHATLNGRPAFRGDQNMDRELAAMRGVDAGEETEPPARSVWGTNTHS